MNKRDFLRNAGFTVGERGRFSADMLNAIAAAEAKGTVFDDAKKPAKPRKPQTKKAATDIVEAPQPEQKKTFPKIPDLPIIRKQETLYALSGQARIGYERCFRPGCFRMNSKCACPQGPKPPAGATPIAEYPRP